MSKMTIKTVHSYGSKIFIDGIEVQKCFSCNLSMQSGEINKIVIERHNTDSQGNVLIDYDAETGEPFVKIITDEYLLKNTEFFFDVLPFNVSNVIE